MEVDSPLHMLGGTWMETFGGDFTVTVRVNGADQQALLGAKVTS